MFRNSDFVIKNLLVHRLIYKRTISITNKKKYVCLLRISALLIKNYTVVRN